MATAEDDPDDVQALHRKIAELEKSQARYQNFFENAPISLWEEDCSEVKKFIDDLRARGITDLKSHFASHPEDLFACSRGIRKLDVNLATLSMYGARNKEEFIASVPMIFGDEGIPSLIERLVAFAAGTTSIRRELTTNTLDGRKLRSLFYVLIPSGCEQTWERCFLALADITEREEIKEAQLRTRMHEETIRAQRMALGALSTPVIPITDDIIVMPLIGVLDSQRMGQMTERLLHEVQHRQSKTAIIDITGVPVMDTAVADAIIRSALSARLLGASVILTGIRPEVAQILVGLGVNLGTIVTLGTLQAGIAFATRRPQ